MTFLKGGGGGLRPIVMKLVILRDVIDVWSPI